MSEPTATPVIGEGIYSIPEAGRIVHCYPRSIRRWVKGYVHSRTGSFSPPILNSEVLNLDGEDIVTFRQLIEILFINLFRHHDVSMPVIRAAATQAANDFHNRTPFALQQLRTDGKRIFSITPEQVERQTHEDGEELTMRQIVKDLAMGQYVIGTFAEPFFRKIDYDQQSLNASRYWPLGTNRQVVIDPTRSLGQPIDPASGVPTRVLVDMIDARESVPVTAKWYEVSEAAVRDAIEFEASLAYSLPKAA